MAKVTDLEWILGRLDAILIVDIDVDIDNAIKTRLIKELVDECKSEIGME